MLLHNYCVYNYVKIYFLNLNVHQIATVVEAALVIFRNPFKHTSKMEIFTKIVNNQKVLSIFAERSILDIWQGSDHVSEFYHCFNSSHGIIQLVSFYCSTIFFSKKEKATAKLSNSYNSNNSQNFAVHIFDLVAFFHNINKAEDSRRFTCFLVPFHFQLIIPKYVNDYFSFFCYSLHKNNSYSHSEPTKTLTI